MKDISGPPKCSRPKPKQQHTLGLVIAWQDGKLRRIQGGARVLLPHDETAQLPVVTPSALSCCVSLASLPPPPLPPSLL